MCHVGARIFTNVLLVSGRGTCLSLGPKGLKCLYLLPSSFSRCGSPLGSCFPLASRLQVQFPLCAPSAPCPGARHGHVCVCIWWPVLTGGRSRRGGGPSFASHVSIPTGVCQMNELAGLASKAAAFFHRPFSTFSSGECELVGVLRSKPLWRASVVTLTALRCDLRKTCGWKSQAVLAHPSVSLNLLVMVLRTNSLYVTEFVLPFSHDSSKVKPILSLRNMPWKLAPESLLPFLSSAWRRSWLTPLSPPTKLFSETALKVMSITHSLCT